MKACQTTNAAFIKFVRMLTVFIIILVELFLVLREALKIVVLLVVLDSVVKQ